MGSDLEPDRGDGAETERRCDSDELDSRAGVSRRTFLIGAGTLIGAATFDSAARASGLVSVPRGVLPATLTNQVATTEPAVTGVEALLGAGALPGADITFLLRRREDFLFLQFDGYNLRLDGNKLTRVHAGDAYLVVTFTPQHVVEQAFQEDEQSSTSGYGAPLFDSSKGNKPPPNPGAARAMLAYPSRLAFLVPRTVSSIPYTLAGLLDWSKLAPNLVEAAAESSGLDTTQWQWNAPIAQQTSLELPWHLAISPSADANWSHPTELLESNGAAELWHTRLANGTGQQAIDGGNFRGVWTFDTIDDPGSLVNGSPTLEFGDPANSNPDKGTFPYIQAMNEWDRWNIVNATANGQSRGRADAYANRLWLSARGGMLDSIGTWNIHDHDPGAGLAEWRHLATLGRDHYVKIVERGFLFPFGHAVTLTIVSERQFQQVGIPGVSSEVNTVGAFRQVSYLSVREPFLSYDSAVAPGIANDSRDFPFRDITLKTLRSAYLLEPYPELPGLPPKNFGNVDVFVPTNDDGSRVTWHAVATDWAGRSISMVLPALYISDGISSDTNAMQAVRETYNALSTSDPHRTADLQGQTVAFGSQHKPGDTDLKVQTITFGAAPGGFGDSASTPYDDYSIPDVRPSLLPSYGQAVVRLSAAEQASGGGALPGNSEPAFSYYEPYVTNSGGFGGANVGNVFVQSVGSVGNLVFGGGSSGGVLTPNVAIEGLSRSLGPVADLDNIFKGNFDPTTYFKQLESAKLLGGVTLGDVIKAVGLLDGSALDPGGADPPSTPDTPNSQVPQLSYSDDGTAITVTINWTPVITLNSDGSPQSPNMWLASSNGSDSIPITLQGEITSDVLNPSNTTYSFTGELQNFTFILMSTDLEFIGISFDSLSFSSATGQGTKVNPQGLSAQFLGSLTFLNDLEDLLSFAGDGGGPSISVTPSGITADLSISIPPVGVAIFTLSGISFDANFLLPLDGVSMAVFTFAFASEASPFTVSGGIFGGDGYFKIAIGTGGVQLITVSIAFGAMVSLDIVVASGSVSLTAGLTYTYLADPSNGGKETCVLTAFVKLEGNLSILGIISLSLTFDLTLTWQSPNDLFGSATLSVGISIFCFSTSVSMTVQKQFAGSSPSAGSSSLREAARGKLSAGDASPQPMDFEEQMTSSQWELYVSSFATA
jgi:hypothetical protein